MTAVLLVGAVGSVFPNSSLLLDGVVVGSPLGGLAIQLEPIAAIVIAVNLLGSGYSREAVFRSIGITLVWAMSINAVIAMADVKNNLTNTLQHFWQSNLTTISVAQLAQGNGRFSGIFDQPAQAGFLYGLALLFVLYLGRDHDRPFRMTLVGLLLTAGGLLTISKIFIFVALPLTALLMLRRGPRSRLRHGVVSLGTTALVVLFLDAIGALSALPGGTQLSGFVHALDNPLHILTGGRLGSQGSLAGVWGLVESYAPLGGFGLGGITNYPLDSGWIQGAVTAGYIGIIAYGLLTLILIYRYLVMRKSDPTNGLMFSILALILISTIGFPIYTGNRISGIVFLLLTVIFLSNERWRSELPIEDVAQATGQTERSFRTGRCEHRSNSVGRTGRKQ